MSDTTLTDAYHAVFDAKDRLSPGSSESYLAYEACQKIAELMTALGQAVPQRFDGAGR